MHTKQPDQPFSRRFQQGLGWHLVINLVGSLKSGACSPIWREKCFLKNDVEEEKGLKSGGHQWFWYLQLEKRLWKASFCGEVIDEVVKVRPGEGLARRWVQDSPGAFGRSLTR